MPPPAPATAPAAAVVVVSAGDEARYGFPAADVRQVLSRVALCPLPGGCGALVGLVATRGQVVPVADLATLVTGATGRTARDYVVVLDDPVRPLGLLVDAVDAVELPTLSTSGPTAPGGLGLDVATLGVLRGGIVLLDTRALLEDGRLSVARRREAGPLPATPAEPPGAP